MEIAEPARAVLGRPGWRQAGHEFARAAGGRLGAMGGRAGLDLGRGRGRTSQRMQKIVCLAEAAPERKAREGGEGCGL